MRKRTGTTRNGSLRSTPGSRSRFRFTAAGRGSTTIVTSCVAVGNTDDAATVNRYTGIAGSVSLHIPWDKVEDWKGLAAYARERGLAIGGINSNTFQDADYMLGSLCHPSAAVRAKAVAAIVECYLGGQAAGSAIARILTGDAEPGGRLAETFPLHTSDNPVHVWPAGPSVVEYRESIYVGYRYYDAQTDDAVMLAAIKKVRGDAFAVPADVADKSTYLRATFDGLIVDSAAVVLRKPGPGTTT